MAIAINQMKRFLPSFFTLVFWVESISLHAFAKLAAGIENPELLGWLKIFLKSFVGVCSPTCAPTSSDTSLGERMLTSTLPLCIAEMGDISFSLLTSIDNHDLTPHILMQTTFIVQCGWRIIRDFKRKNLVCCSAVCDPIYILVGIASCCRYFPQI